MKTQIINNNGYKINKLALLKWVRTVGKELSNMHSINQPFIKKTLILAFVNEQEIKQLNHQFRKKNTVTDILSFAPSAEDSLGELALCLPVICKKTPPAFSQQGWLCYLIVHGILHLLGFEHESDKKQARKMYQLQNTVFEKLYTQRVVADRQAKGAALGDSRAGDKVGT